ncbi:HMA2 domain-containing protein [Desulfobacter sp.]
MRLPGAQITHHIRNRVRIRIPEKKGDRSYFNALSKTLDSELKGMKADVSPVTGSLVVWGLSLDLDRLFALAESKGLFARAVCPTSESSAEPSCRISALASRTVSLINTGLKKITKNQLDMSSTAFVLLVIHACREILKGNLTAPSWFTALWFATNIYNNNMKGAGADLDTAAPDDGGADG